jgi:hypothetical protein
MGLASGRYGSQVSWGMYFDLSILALIAISSNCIWIHSLWICVVQGRSFEHCMDKAQPSPDSYGRSDSRKHSILPSVSPPFHHFLIYTKLFIALVVFWSSTLSWSAYVIPFTATVVFSNHAYLNLIRRR